MKNHWLNKNSYKGFPSDDENSMMQGDPYGTCCCNLDIWYNSRFIQNEVVDKIGIFERVPVEPGTLSGTIYLGEDPTYTFSVSTSGVFNFTSLKESEFKVVASSLKLNTGEIDIFWNKIPDKDVKMVVSYEYHLE